MTEVGLEKELRQVMTGKLFKNYKEAFEAIEAMGGVIWFYTGGAEGGQNKWVQFTKQGVAASVLFSKRKDGVRYVGPIQNGI